HPKTNEPMCQNAGSENRISGWDFTFSALKTVSAQLSLLSAEGRAEIENAHNEAVKVAMRHLQDYAAVGRRGDNQRELCDWIYAAFQHDSSREGDPQLHTHCYVFNLGCC